MVVDHLIEDYFLSSNSSDNRSDGYYDVFEVNVVGDKGYDDVGYLRNPFGNLNIIS